MIKGKTIFIDLDGTILDVSDRIYTVYKNILSSRSKKFISKDDYVELKRNRVLLEDILEKTQSEDILNEFKKEWMDKIESDDFLRIDKIFPLVMEKLIDFKEENRLVLVTLRNSSKNLFVQLEDKGLDKIFDKVLVSSGRGHDEKWKIKERIIREYENYNSDKSIIIGDTETDILAGKNLGIKTIAVTKGMRTEEILKECNPDIIVDSLSMIGLADLY